MIDYSSIIGSLSPKESINTLKTECIFNTLFDTNGLPIGRIIDLSGEESSGKSALALQVIADLQKNNYNSLYIDADHKIDIRYLKKIGINLDNIFIVNPSTGEEILDIVEKAITSKVFNFIVIDSIAAIVSKKEKDQSMYDNNDNFISNFIVKCSKMIINSDCSILLINQLRSGKYGKYPICKKILGLYSSVSIETEKQNDIIINEHKIGERILFQTTRNNITRKPNKNSTYDIIY